jgi:hypothetical protein
MCEATTSGSVPSDMEACSWRQPSLAWVSGCRTCQWTLVEQQVLRDVVDGRGFAQALLGGEGKAHEQASTAGEEQVSRDEDHHEFGRHGGRRVGKCLRGRKEWKSRPACSRQMTIIAELEY